MACFLILAALTGRGDALTPGNLAQVTVVDRETGTVLTPHYYRGEYWVAGQPGTRYGIEIHNRQSGRLLAVISVDGLNVLSGQTAAWSQTGYVFDPWQAYSITGWRKNDSEVAAFTFTESPHSYAERTGRPANVGVIGVALFREQPPPPVVAAEQGGVADLASPQPPAPAPAHEPSTRSSGGMPSPPPPPPSAAADKSGPSPGGAARLGPSGAGRTSESAPAPARPEPKLGTGHGERETSIVTHTEFERLQEQPNEIVRIHYDSLANLIAMGIIPRPRTPAPTPNPFPGSQQYVPDPPPELP
jgi:hypothetical protein